MMLGLALLSMNTTSFNNKVKLGGVLPMLSSTLDYSSKQLDNLENICRDYHY